MDSSIKALAVALVASLVVGPAALGLSGCATSKDRVIPQDGPDMASVYAQHQRAAGLTSTVGTQRPAADRDTDLFGYTQQASNEVEQVFPLLPNPQLVLFVFPHLSAEGAPVPGYSTAFPMYAVDQYAMPGELYQP